MRSELERRSRAALPLDELPRASTSTSRSRGPAGASRSAARTGSRAALRRDDEARARASAARSRSRTASLFRDPEQFALLEEVLLPRLLAGGRRLSAWSAGCADGAELHTLGLVLERMGALERSLLLGSDLLEENLALARASSTYPRGRAGAVRWERRDLVGGRAARRALAARPVPQRRDLPVAAGRAGALYATLVVRARARAASCCSGAASG